MTSAGSTDLLAVDIGGGTVRCALVAADGAVLQRGAVPTPSGAGSSDGIGSRLKAFLDGPPVAAVGVASAGLIAPATGVVRYAGNLGWRDEPLGEALTRALDVRVVVDNDVRLAALAEAAARGADSLALIAIGTGLAAGIIDDGRPLRGIGGAGEVGHITVVAGGLVCSCGALGCVEAYMSGRVLTERCGVPPAESWAGRGADPGWATAWREATAALAVAVRALVLAADPALVVLGGGVAGIGQPLVAEVARLVAEGMRWRSTPPLQLAVLGTDAGLLGAALAVADAAPAAFVARWNASGRAHAQ